MKSLLASCAAVAVALASAACGTSYGTSRSEAPQLAAYPAETPGGAAVTLGAATVSAQGIVDSFAAGDIAEVWEHMAQEVRQGITREDFVEFYKTCKKPGPRLSVEGLRMEPDGQAIVRVMNHGAGGSRFMVYEDGAWNMRATADFAAHLGQPLQRIISEEKAAGLCDS